MKHVSEEKKVPLTPNKMILLLQIYRGIGKQDVIVTEENSYTKDVRFLLQKGLIAYDGVHSVTARGTLRVMDVLNPDDVQEDKPVEKTKSESEDWIDDPDGLGPEQSTPKVTLHGGYGVYTSSGTKGE